MKISIRFFNDKEVRAAWNEKNNRWYFSVLDIIGAIRKEDNYEKCRNYWKYLKAKLKKENSELVSATTQLKLIVFDVTKYILCVRFRQLFNFLRYFKCLPKTQK